MRVCASRMGEGGVVGAAWASGRCSRLGGVWGWVVWGGNAGEFVWQNGALRQNFVRRGAGFARVCVAAG